MSQKPIELLRSELSAQGVSGFIIPRTDEFQNEYTGPNAERLKYISNFTGSAGLAIVLTEKAAIFVDGRYTLQAKDEVEGGDFEIHNLTQSDMVSWLEENLSAGDKLAYDPWLALKHEETAFKAACDSRGAELVSVDNLVDRIWVDQPLSLKSEVVPHDLKFTGETIAEKVSEVVLKLKAQNLSALVYNQPDLICWLLNMRGEDVPCTPMALSYAIVHQNATVDLFLDNHQISAELKAHFESQISNLSVHPIQDFEAYLQKLDGKSVLVDPASSPVAIANTLTASGAEVALKADPTMLMRAAKHKVEVEGMRVAHIRDGAALCTFFAWLEANLGTMEISENDLAEKLLELRSQQQNFKQPSFHPIAGFAGNGAIVHYRAPDHGSAKLTKDEMLLLDSGGQYLEGTTDVTRTVYLGETPSAEQKDRYTRVLKGHIALKQAKFPQGTPGSNLDILARSPLWEVGLDFAHGTGHGVGSYLSVHEGPQRISQYPNKVGLVPGMVVSNEPGFYKAGEYGIRIENLVVVQESKASDQIDICEFEDLTLVPHDAKLINVDMLTEAEITYLNDYHQQVYDKVSPLLDAAGKAWLATQTKPLGQ